MLIEPTIVCRINYRKALSHADAEMIAHILCDSQFAALQRVATAVGDRVVDHRRKDIESIKTAIVEQRSSGVELSPKRGTPLTAFARISNGRPIDPGDTRPAPLMAYAAVPYSRDLTKIIELFKQLAVIVDCVVGVVTVEANFTLANMFANSSRLATQDMLRQPGMTMQRLQERRAHLYGYRLSTQIAGPEWGLLISSNHYHAVGAESIQTAHVFAEVSTLSERLYWLQLTNDPLDAISQEFDDLLNGARLILKPILMDLSELPPIPE